MKRFGLIAAAIALIGITALFNSGGNRAIAASTILVGDPFSTPDGSFPYTCGAVVNPCDTIQHGVDTASAGDTLDIAAGPYNENVTINKRLILDGAGNSPIGTVITSGTANTPTINIDGDASTGTSASDRLVLKDLRITGATGGSGNLNSGVRIFGSVSTQHVTFDKVSVVNNTGNGIAFDHTGTVGDIEVKSSELSNNGNAGFRIPTSVGSFNGLTITGGTFDNNSINGLQTGASGSPNVTNITIDGTTFNGNGTATSGGDGDISLFKFNGNATIKNVVINADSHIGLQVRGTDPVLAPAGTVVINNVKILGNPRFGMSIIGYSDVSGISFINNSKIATTSNYSLYLENLGTTLNVGNTEFGVSNLVASIANVSASDVDATSASFTGGPGNFTIEDKVLHGVDAPGGGTVFWVPNTAFVSVNSFVPPLSTSPSIQRGVDAVNTNGVVNVQAGVWNAPVTISTDGLSLRGAQYGVDPRPSCSPGSQTVQRRSIQMAANNVTVDGFTVAEVGSDGVAPGPVGPANPDSLGTGIYAVASFSGHTIRNNVIRDNIFGVYFNSNGVNPSSVDHNCFNRNNEPGAAAGDGIYSDGGLSNATVKNNKFTAHDSAAMVFAAGPGNSTLTIDSNDSTNDSSIVLFKTTNSTVTNNTFTNPNGSAIFLGGDNNGLSVNGNTVSASAFSGVRVGAFFGFGDNANLDIFNNSLSGTGASTAYGVRVTAGVSSGLQIHDNSPITGHFRGIDVDSANGALIEDNNISGFSGACVGTDDCSMGIRVLNSTGVGINGNTVTGPHTGSCVGGYWGIYAKNSGGGIDGNSVTGIGNGVTTGCQEGRAIEAKGAGTVSITNNVVNTYQKSGIIVRDTVNSTISGNTTTGEGPSGIIAMNGITVTSTGTTSITGNHTSGHAYTPTSDIACGILTLNTATISGNDSTSDEVGICAIGGAGSQVLNNQVDKHRQQGILVDGASNIVVDGNDIDGQGSGTTASAGTDPDSDVRYYGIFAVDSTGAITSNVIHGITHGPSNGLQSGVGIRVTARSGGSSDMTIADNNVFDYQKNAMVITNFYGGALVHAIVDGNTTVGSGPVNYIAQNGIQLSSGATGTISDNDVSGNDYTPNSAAAVGILVLDAGATTVTQNNVHNNMEGTYIQETDNAVVSSNSYTANRDTGIVLLLSNSGSYTGNQVFGQPNSYGIYMYDLTTNNTFANNAIRNHTYGITVDYTDPFTIGDPTGNVFNTNCIAGNTTYGMGTVGAQVGGPINAENNWWGKVNGPNPPGNGDVITPPADIDALPFLVAPVAGCPVPLDGDGDGINDPQDNCPTVNNPSQANTNGEPMLLPKPEPAYNDATNPSGDNEGDACDPDIDGDGVLNGAETTLGLSPFVWDTDGDRTNDGTEILCGSDPLVATTNLSGTDSDNDRLPNSCEAMYGTNPNNGDSDGDGVRDGAEVRYWLSNPLVSNSDSDGCTDAREIGSINGDHAVNVIDLQQLAAHAGLLAPEFRPFDSNGDGTINVLDLQFAAAHAGQCTPA